MSDYFTAIADVGETLIYLLREGLKDLIPQDSITLFSPGEIEAGSTPRLCLFLYQVVENSHLKNQEPERKNSQSLIYPGLALDLYYMLIPYAASNIPDTTERTTEEHRLLGRAMQVLHDNAILRDPLLRGGLAGRGFEIKAMLHNTSIDEITKIWHSLPAKSFKPSVCYLLTPVVIGSGKETHTKRVAEVRT